VTVRLGLDALQRLHLCGDRLLLHQHAVERLFCALRIAFSDVSKPFGCLLLDAV